MEGPGLYYFGPGSDDGVGKFFIFHQGGGFCESDDSCLDRSSGTLGSTKSDSDTQHNPSLGMMEVNDCIHVCIYNMNRERERHIRHHKAT